MNVQTAAQLVALRPCIEAFLVRACLNPETAETFLEEDVRLLNILKHLSSPVGWSPGNEAVNVQPKYASIEAVPKGNYNKGYRF